MIRATPVAAVLGYVAAAAETRITIGEWAVTVSAIVLAVVTIAAVVLTYYLINVSKELINVTRQDAELIAKANNLALTEMGDVASDAIDASTTIATTAIRETDREDQS